MRIFAVTYLFKMVNKPHTTLPTEMHKLMQRLLGRMKLVTPVPLSVSRPGGTERERLPLLYMSHLMLTGSS